MWSNIISSIYSTNSKRHATENSTNSKITSPRMSRFIIGKRAIRSSAKCFIIFCCYTFVSHLASKPWRLSEAMSHFVFVPSCCHSGSVRRFSQLQPAYPPPSRSSSAFVAHSGHRIFRATRETWHFTSGIHKTALASRFLGVSRGEETSITTVAANVETRHTVRVLRADAR